MELKKILDDFKADRLSRDQTAELLAKLPYESLDFAKLDHHRRQRKGQPETVFCPGKTPEQLAIIFQRFQEAGSNVLGTRASPEHCQAVKAAIPAVGYHPVGRLLTLETTPVEQRGLVAVCTGGTADIPVAEEAAGTAEFLGSRVLRCYDVGVAGIHRLFANLDELRHANALIAIAGMEGALGSVLAGLVAVCTGGTADIPVAEEAAGTAEFLGSRVLRCYDIGVAGIHRLFANLDELRRANALIAIAGMEGALGSVLAGLVANPVIAVPTSVGYGASFQGLAPLLTMLNSCAEGMAVVNIDNGFGAGYIASQINLLAAGQAGTVPGAGG